MKKRFAIWALAFCLALIMLPARAWAAEDEPHTSGPWGLNLTWTYAADTKTMTISGSGMMEQYNASIDEDAWAWFYPYHKELENLVIENGISSIAEEAFSGCSKLRHVTLPEGIVAIGDGAFEGCQNLTGITIPQSVRFIGSGAFRETGLSAVTIPAGVLTVENNTFRDCKSLTAVTLPGGILRIGERAFQGCTSLTGITLPDTVREISGYAFTQCSALKEITLPKSITDIGSAAFWQCENLTSVTFPDTGSLNNYDLLWIGSYAFSGCLKLANINLPEGLRALARETFSGCSSLTSITLPESLNAIGKECFKGCEKLTKIEYGDSRWRWDYLRALYDSDPDASYYYKGIADDIVDDWDKIGLDCLDGGTCGSGVHWYYSEKTNILYIATHKEDGADNIIRRPEDGSLDKWNAALAKQPLIYIEHTFGIAEGAFEADTIVHRYPASQNYPTPSGLQVHGLEDDKATYAYIEGRFCTEEDEECWSYGLSCTEENCPQKDLLAPFAAKQFELPHRPTSNSTYSSSATCVREGTAFDIRCEDCGKQLAGPVELPLASHSFTKDWKTTQKATCTTPGIWTWTWRCTIPECHYVETHEEQIPIAPSNHDYGAWVITKAPTATALGEKQRECTRCGKTQKESISRTNDTTHIVTINPAGGVSDNQNDLLFTDLDGNITALPAAPTRQDYRFDGWYTAATGGTKLEVGEILPEGTDTVYAHWTKETALKHTVTFNFNYSDAPANTTASVTDGEKVSSPTAPVRDGFLFKGWYTDSDGTTEWNFDTPVTGPITLYAKWEKDEPGNKTYKITFNANGGSVSPSSAVTNADGKVSLPTPTRTGHTFAGWYTSPSGGSAVTASTTFDADTTLYAHWVENSSGKTYTITFDANGGTGGSTITTLPGGILTSAPSTPTRAGYTFDGWYTAAIGGTKIPISATFTQFDTDLTLYAHWIPNGTTPVGKTCTVTFNPNGGTGGAVLVTGTDGRLAALPGNPTLSGYTFAGWYTDPLGGVQVGASTVFSADTTVYAHWNQFSSTPSAAYYQIYTPGTTYGGSLSASHSFAAPGTLVTVTSSPWSNFELSQLQAIRADTGWQLYLTGRYGNQYTFVMPDSDVQLIGSYTQTYTGTVAPVYPGPNTSTVYPEASAYAKPVNWYFSGGYIYHVTDGLVPTGTALSRDMLVSVLYNMDSSSSGSPAIWAAQNGVISDIFRGELWGPDKSISREQAAMILFCYAQYKGYATNQRSSLTGYTDYRQIRAIARPAMAWSRAVGVITATSARTLSPQAILNCGEANAILTRFVSNVTNA